MFASRAQRHAAAASSSATSAAPNPTAAANPPPHHTVGAAPAPLLAQGDFGLLHAVDDRLAAYGWETNTGVRFVAVVDMRGRVLDRSLPGGGGISRSTSNASTGPGARGSAADGGSTAGAGAASTTAGGAGPGSSGGAATMATGSVSAAAAAVAAALGTKVVGLRDGELKVVFRAMQTAYIRLLQNPFYNPDETASAPAGRRITSRRFIDEMRRIGEVWVPGSVNAL